MAVVLLSWSIPMALAFIEPVPGAFSPFEIALTQSLGVEQKSLLYICIYRIYIYIVFCIDQYRPANKMEKALCAGNTANRGDRTPSVALPAALTQSMGPADQSIAAGVVLRPVVAVLDFVGEPICRQQKRSV